MPREMRAIAVGLRELGKTLNAYIPRVQEQVREIQRRAAKTTAERPMLALGVAFMAGMALGIALFKPRD